MGVPSHKEKWASVRREVLSDLESRRAGESFYRGEARRPAETSEFDDEA